MNIIRIQSNSFDKRIFEYFTTNVITPEFLRIFGFRPWWEGTWTVPGTIFSRQTRKTAIGKRHGARPTEIIQFDQAMFETKLDAMLREKIERIINAMLDAEADEIANAARYVYLVKSSHS